MIKLENINKTYKLDGAPLPVLKDISLSIGEGEFVAIMGPSGSGKSTLLHILGFLDKPDKGLYEINGRDCRRINDTTRSRLRLFFAGFVFQNFYLLPRKTALQNVQLPLLYARSRDVKGISRKKIEGVALSARARNYPRQMSGGEKQRIAIARALANDPPLILADEPTGSLDSKNGEQIMALLRELNTKGKTIILVTHDPKVAQYADRVICMKDGGIESDQSIHNDPRPAAGPENSSWDRLVERIFKGRARGPGIFMRLGQSLGAVMAHKTRSFLSILGIIIGVASIIAMIALGTGVKESIISNFVGLGPDLLTVLPGQDSDNILPSPQLSITDVLAISHLPMVKAVSGIDQEEVQVAFRSKGMVAVVLAGDAALQGMDKEQPVEGRFFTADEDRRHAEVALIGPEIQQGLFGSENPLGRQIHVNNLIFTVIGVLPHKGSQAGQDNDSRIIIPLGTEMYSLSGKKYVDLIMVQIKENVVMKDARMVVEQSLFKGHKILTLVHGFFSVQSSFDAIEAFNKSAKMLALLIGGIAVITLLVGGIGIMNIMLVSVMERTQEIGIYKSIGASSGDISFQFFVEALVLTFSGGIGGVFLGLGACSVLNRLTSDWHFKPDLFSILAGVGSSIVIGLICGIFPAGRASKLDPIKSLRFE